jgi:hypothetical protein
MNSTQDGEKTIKLNNTKKLGLFIVVFLSVASIALAATAIPNLFPFLNCSGAVATYSSAGSFDISGPFFQSWARTPGRVVHAYLLSASRERYSTAFSKACDFHWGNSTVLESRPAFPQGDWHATTTSHVHHVSSSLHDLGVCPIDRQVVGLRVWSVTLAGQRGS